MPSNKVPLANSKSENKATSPVSGSTTSAPTRKIRSCFVCRQRKVRCDKQSPCGNCRRAGIPCVLPPTDRPPRWARRRELLASNAAASASTPQTAVADDTSMTERIRYLENLVGELSNQLQHARTIAASSGYGSSAVPSPGSVNQTQDEQVDQRKSSPSEADTVGKQFGRIVLQDEGRTRYVSGGFWSRINDELGGLNIDNDDPEEDEFASSDSEQWHDKESFLPRNRNMNLSKHASLFRQYSTPWTTDLREFHPLPSQIPFLLEIFAENVNSMMCIVHMPTVKRIIHDMRSNGSTNLSASNEALLFAIYHGAVASMEEDEIKNNFGESQDELRRKYRFGLEYALAKADFLSSPDLTLVQALAIFLILVRRYDSPRYVWMMSGLLVRIAYYLGLQRDGSHLKHLTPFEVHMRRRVWWAVCLIDVRVSEDQGTDISIQKSSFDTRLPLNINDEDIDQDTVDDPEERSGATDISFLRAVAGITDVTMQMMTSNPKNDKAGLDAQNELLNEVYRKVEQEYLQHVTADANIYYWTAVTVAQVVIRKLTLLVYLPVLFSSTSEQESEDIRCKLLIAAIELAEYDHALHVEPAVRHWRWIWQTHTHWYAIVFLLLETSRRAWSPNVERAWIVLRNGSLFPPKTLTPKNRRFWFPLRKLMHKARMHRDSELKRLRAHPSAAARLEEADQSYPSPSSSGLAPDVHTAESFRERWRRLVAASPLATSLANFTDTNGDQSTALHYAMQSADELTNNTHTTNIASDAGPTQLSWPVTDDNQAPPNPVNINSGYEAPSAPTNFLGPFDNSRYAQDWAGQPILDTGAYAGNQTAWPEFAAWLWTDVDPSNEASQDLNMNLDTIDPVLDFGEEMNWCSWIESANTMA